MPCLGITDQLMNMLLTPEMLTLSVAHLRNGRTLSVQKMACDMRLGGKHCRQNLLRPELISDSLEAPKNKQAVISIIASVFV